MRDFKDCVPADARAYYIELFKHRTSTERAKYDAKLLAIQNALAAQGVRRSGHADKASWDAKAEFLDALAIGCVEDVLAVYEERELVLTPPICTCLAETAREHLDALYRQQLKLSAERMLGFHLLNSSIQEMSTRKFAALPRINILIERARRASERKRDEKVCKETPSSVTIHNTTNYNTQNIGGRYNTATMLGDVTQRQQYNFNQLAVELESLRNELSQRSTVDAEDLKLLEDAEKAVKEHDETKMQRCLRALSDGFRESAKSAGVELGKQGFIELAKYLAIHGIHLLK